jgi:hypothetical protein
MSSQPSESFRCGFYQQYASVRFFSKGGASWPFVRLYLEEDAFALRLWRVFLPWGYPDRIRYETVAEAGLRTEFPPHIRIRLTDPSKGVIWITTRNEGAIELANRLEQRGVLVRDEAESLRDLIA